MAAVALDGDNDLINIKRAARFLSVSEVSLRRWTDSGKLSCLRVGARRERRFRRSDLLAFLERQDAGQQNTGHAIAGRTPTGRAVAPNDGKPSGRVVLEGIAIADGHHLCSLYQNDLGRLKLSVPFLAEGLRGGDVCYLIAAADGQRRILESLRDVFPDLDEAVADGRLVVSEGQATGPEMYAYLEESFVRATRPGNQFLRLVGDMVWALEKGVAVDDLMEFEMRYNHTLARRFPIVSLCQYDVRAFSGTAVHEVLICHEDTFSYPLSRFI